MRCEERSLLFLLLWEQDDSEDSETEEEEDGSQSSTNLQPASRFHRYNTRVMSVAYKGTFWGEF